MIMDSWLSLENCGTQRGPTGRYDRWCLTVVKRRGPADGRLPPQPTHKNVASFDGTQIHYDVYEALSSSIVVVVPGFWRDRRHPSMVHLAGWLQAGGHRCAVIDVRGHGASGGTYGFNLHEHHDIAAVCGDILLGTTPISSITLLGFSYGGAVAISTAARHDLPISSLVLVSPVADFAMIAPRMNLFSMHRHLAFSQALKRPRFGWNVRRTTKLRAVDEIRNVHVPLCLIHVKDDWLIGHRHSEALFAAAGDPKELHLLDVPGNYHADRIFRVAPEIVEPIVTRFLSRHAG